MIVGQEPYPKYTQAMGVAFGVNIEKTKPSSSLVALVNELEEDLDTLVLSPDYSLTSWANQGVLLINTALTLRRNEIGSHLHLWKPFMNDFMEAMSLKYPELIVVAVGEEVGRNLTMFPNRIPVDSFRGSKIFSQINDELVKHKLEPIDWRKGWNDG